MMGYMPHGNCYLWQPALVWTHATSDGVIALSYAVIPVALIYFVRKRKDLPFNWMFFCFAAFIIGCGATHAMEIWAIWKPYYWLSASVKIVTAVVSAGTAVALIQLMPAALALPSPKQLESINRDLHTEISKRKKGEKQFQDFLEFAPDAIVIVNDHGKIVLINRQAENLFKFQRNELIEQPIEMLLPQRFKGKHVHHRQEYFGNPRFRGMGVGLDLYALRKDGTEFPVEISLSPLETEEGILVCSAIRDITERKKLEQTKIDLIRFASHQLKTPLAQIYGFMDNLLGGLSGSLNEKQKRYLTLVKDISSDNLHLVNDLLSISRIEAGILTADIRPTSLNELVLKSLENYKEMIENKGLSLAFEEESKHVLVLADPQKAEEAIKNVINNAVKFTDQGTITIKIKTAARMGIVEISDTGIGISQDVLDHLFTKELILSQTGDSRGGSGLGLYIAKSFVLLQQGNILATSTVGQGSQFTVKFQKAPGEEE